MVTSRSHDNAPKTNIDLQKIIQDYAWNMFTKSVGKPKSMLLRKSNYAFDFEWKFVDFSHSTHMTDIKAEDEIFNSSDFGTPTAPKNQGLRRSDRQKKLQTSQNFYKKVQMDFDDPVVMDTVYVKNTSSSAEVKSFSSLSLASTINIELSQCFSLGGATNFAIDVSSGKKYNVTNCETQEFRDVCVLNFDQKVLINAGQRVEVIFLAREKTEKFNFEVTTQLSLVIGCLPVAIRRKSDGKIMFTCFITSLHDVFDKYVGPYLSLAKNNRGGLNVSVKSRGKCKFTKWIEPEVMALAEPLEPEFEEHLDCNYE